MVHSLMLIGYTIERRQALELLIAASDAERASASWQLADYYANQDAKAFHDKIEHYCLLAFADGKIYSDKDEDSLPFHSLPDWIKKNHPEWCEMTEGFYDSGKYFLYFTDRYGLNVFRGLGETEARKRLKAE